MPDDKPFAGPVNTFLEDLFQPLGEPIGRLGAAAGRLIGAPFSPETQQMLESVGQRTGAGIPRFAADVAAYGARSPFVKAAGLGDVALRAYAQPGATLGSTALQTGAFAAAPVTGGVGSKLANMVASRATSRIASPVARYAAEEGARRIGGIAGAVAPFEAAQALEQYGQGQTYQPFTAENVAETAASVLPFEAMHIPRIAREFQRANTPLVNEVNVSDNPQVWRVHYTAHDIPRQREFTDEQAAMDYSDEIRKQLHTEPQVELAGTMPRQYTQRSMAFKPEQLRANLFGLRSSEVLNELPDTEMPGKQLWGTIKNKVPKSELEALPGFEDFLTKNPKVAPSQVQQWLDENAPKVEIRSAGAGTLHPDAKAFNQFQHEWYDTFDSNGKHVLETVAEGTTTPQQAVNLLGITPDKQPEFLANAQKYHDLFQKSKAAPFNPQEAHWAQVSPKPESEMKDYVELAVVAGGKTLHGEPTKFTNERGTIRFNESHSFPPNTLGWARGYMDTPTEGRFKGKKVFHVVEMQSDWAAQRRDNLKDIEGMTPEQVSHEFKGGLTADHPLLPQWERLVMKAVIDHARKQGADAIAVSDAETAMMTEGHDLRIERDPDEFVYKFYKPAQPMPYGGKIRQPTGKFYVAMPEAFPGSELIKNVEHSEKFEDATGMASTTLEFNPHIRRFNTRPEAVAFVKELFNSDLERLQRLGPSQSPGMRLHYDKILPQILRDLTGEKGERVTLGEHKMAYDVHDPMAEDAFIDEDGAVSGGEISGRSPRANLIFQEGNQPKTLISANAFSLDRLNTEFAKRHGFPMFGGEKFVKDHVERMNKEGATPEEMAKAVGNLKMLEPLPGETALQTLARSIGIESKLFANIPPGEAIPRALQMLTSHFHYNYGLPLDHAAYLARQTALPLARFAQWIPNTAFALAPFEDFRSKFITATEPKSQIDRFLITLHDRSPGIGNLASKVFDTARTLGHEAVHNMVRIVMEPMGDVNQEHRRAGIRALANVEAIHPDIRADVMRGLLKVLVPKNQLGAVNTANFDRYKESSEEFLADFGALIAVGSASKGKVAELRDMLTYGDRASQNFSKAVYKDLTSIWSGVKDMIKFFTGSGKPNHEGKIVASLVDEVYNNLTKLMATAEEAERTLDGFQGYMERMQAGPMERPSVVSQKQIDQLFRHLHDLDKDFGVQRSEESEKATDEAIAWRFPWERPKVAGERLGFWRDFFKPMSQLVESLKEKVPSAIPVKALGFDYRSLVSASQNLTWGQWVNDQGKVDWKRLQWLGKDGTAQERAFSAVGLVENVRTQKGETEPLTREQKEKMVPAYRGLSDENKEKVDTSLDQAWEMTRIMARRQWDAHRDRITTEMSKILMSYDKNMYHEQAKELATQAVGYFFDTPRDLTQFQDFFNEREKFFSALLIPDKGKQDLQDAILANREPWKKLGDTLLGQEDPTTGIRPGKMAYLPEVRVREWHVAFKLTDEDQPHHEAYKTEAEAAKRIQVVNKKDTLEWVKSFNRKDRTERFRGAVQEEISSAQQDALDALKASVLSRISSEHPEAEDIIKQINEEFQPATAFQNVSVSPYMREREFIPGREDLNMVEGLVRYIDAASYQLAKRYVKQTGQVVLFNPDMRENPNIRNNFEKYLRFVTDAEGKEFSTLKNLVFFHYLGLNPVQILIEPAQQLLTLAPYMIENGMNVGKAYEAMVRANKDIAVSMAKGGKMDNPDEEKALRDAENGRVIDTGFVSDLYGVQDLDFAASRSSFSGNDKIREGLDLIKKPLYQLLSVARHMYGRSTPAINGRVAFLTSFRYAREQGKSYNEAVSFATQATDATMFGGGKAARPMVLQRFGSMSGVGGLMYTLGSYTFNSVAMMGRLFRKSLFSTTLPPEQKVAAQKAFATMLGTQVLLGGALGLPTVAASIAVLEQIFPGFDGRLFMRNTAEHLAKLATDDEDMGHTIADGALRGVVNVGPVDFGSRFQLANMLGVSPYDGFSWNNLAGPAANMLENYVKATGLASQGHFEEAARMAAPSSVKQVLQLVHDEGAVRDKAGRMLSEMTPAEVALSALGFKPKRLTNYYEEQAIRERTEANQARQVRDIRTEAAKYLVQGDAESAKKTIVAGTAEAGPYDPFAMAREASQLAVEMQNPTLRRHGTKAMAEQEAAISQLYPQSVGISEVQRVLRQAAMVRQMGMQFGRPSLEELRTARLVDNLMQQNPKLTVNQARAMVEQRLSPAIRRRGSISSLLQAQP